MSWKVEVQADNTGTWASNALRFASKHFAELYAIDLERRWTAVRSWRVVKTKDKVNEPQRRAG